MLELWQAEWCSASSRVREHLTELGVDYVVRQVPVEKAERTALVRVAGSDTIPALLPDDGPAIVGEDAIHRYLESCLREPSEAAAHRAKAEKARRRYLQEECECLQLRTP
jgi:glutathione S-transferase